MNIKFYYILAFCLITQILTAQDKGRFYDLDEVLELATSNVLELKEANSFLKENQLQINLLAEQLKPQVLVNATLPNLSRSIELRPLPDGRDSFVNRSTMYNGVEVRMNYQLTSTGGTIYARSSLDRIDILKTAQFDYSRNYFFTPISVGISQPLFQFNEVKWQKKRNNLLHQELTTQQFFVREEVIQSALLKYAAAFLAQLELTVAKQKITETDSLYQIKKRLFAIGKATKIEMLRLGMEQERNAQSLEQKQLDWEKFKMELCDYLDLNEEFLNGLNPPPILLDIKLNENEVVKLALSNAYILARDQRRLREAETEIEIAEKDRGILFDLDLSLGLNKSNNELEGLVQNLQDRQTFSLGITMPLTAGKSRSFSREIAQEQFYREQLSIQQEKTDVARTVEIDVKTYALLNKNIKLNEKNMDTTQEIFELASQQYLLGNQSITELNILRSERDQALFQHYQSILDATLKYYEIRKNCLYDFQERKSLLKD